MTALFYFSGSGHSLAVAKAVAEHLNCNLYEIGKDRCNSEYETVVVVFPVYCQNIPEPVKAFLRKLSAKNVVVLATYGKFSWGNVLFDSQRLVKGCVIAGALIPTGHTFLKEGADFDFNAILPALNKIKFPSKAKIPRKKKVFYASLFPALRSRISVKIKKNKKCLSCSLCSDNCPVDAIKSGVINHRCIRCLKCVTNCPCGALEFENTAILEKYLSKPQKKDIEIYL